MNDNIEHSHLNGNLQTKDHYESTTITPSSFNERMPVSEELVLIANYQISMDTSTNETKEIKRKLKLTIPHEKIVFESGEVDDDITPEYPLKDGYMFFNQIANMKEQMKIPDQNINFFSDVTLPFQSTNKQVANSSVTSINRTQREDLHQDFNIEHVKPSRGIQDASNPTLGKPKLLKSRREHLLVKLNAEVSLLNPDIVPNGNSSTFESVTSTVKLIDSNVTGRKDCEFVINNSKNVGIVNSDDSRRSRKVEIINKKETIYLSRVTEQSCGIGELHNSQVLSQPQKLIPVYDNNITVDIRNNKPFKTTNEFSTNNHENTSKLKTVFTVMQEHEDIHFKNALCTNRGPILMKEMVSENSNMPVENQICDSINTKHNDSELAMQSSLDYETSKCLKRSLGSVELGMPLNTFKSDWPSRDDIFSVLESTRPSDNCKDNIKRICSSEANQKHQENCMDSFRNETTIDETSRCNIISNSESSSCTIISNSIESKCCNITSNSPESNSFNITSNSAENSSCNLTSNSAENSSCNLTSNSAENSSCNITSYSAESSNSNKTVVCSKNIHTSNALACALGKDQSMNISHAQTPTKQAEYLIQSNEQTFLENNDQEMRFDKTSKKCLFINNSKISAIIKEQLYKRSLLHAVKGCSTNKKNETTEVMSEESEHQVPYKQFRSTHSCRDDEVNSRCNISTKKTMGVSDDLQVVNKINTLSNKPRKGQSIVENGLISSSIISEPEEKSQHTSIIDIRASESELCPDKDSHIVLGRSAPQILDTCKLMHNSLSLARSTCVSVGSHVELKSQQEGISTPKNSSLKKDAPCEVQQSTRNIVEYNEIITHDDKMNGYKTEEEAQINVNSEPFSLFQHCYDAIIADPCKSSLQKSNFPKENAITKSAPMPDSMSFRNMAPRLILQTSERNSDYYKGIISNNQQVHSYSNNYNQPEQDSATSNISKASTECRDVFSSETIRTDDYMQPQGKNWLNRAIVQPSFDPLWKNKPYNSLYSAEVDLRCSVLPCSVPPIPLERNITQIRNVNKEITISESQNVNQQIQTEHILHPAEALLSENLNMLRHAEAIRAAQQNSALHYFMEPEDRPNYLSWMKIGKQALNKDIPTSKSHDLQSIVNSSTLSVYEKGSQKSQFHSQYTPVCNAYSLSDSCILRCNSARLSEALERDEGVGSSREPSPPCEPLDLSRHSETVQSEQFPVPFQACYNLHNQHTVPVTNYSQSLKTNLPTSVSGHPLYSAELYGKHLCSSSSNYLSPHIHDKSYNREPASLITTFVTLGKTASTQASLASVRNPVTHKFPLLETALQNNIVPVEGNLHPFNKVNLKQISQVAPCEKNKAQVYTDNATTIYSDIDSQLTCDSVTTTTRINDRSTTVSNAHKVYLSENKVIALSSPNASITSCLTQSSVAGKFISSSDLTTEMKCDSISSPHFIEATFSQAFCTLSSSADTEQRKMSAHSDCTNVKPAFVHPVADNASSRFAPLPIKDFFTHNPKENTYSSLLMAKITSQNMRSLDSQNVTEVLPLYHLDNIKDNRTVEVGNHLQGNLVIDLTDGYDDSDVVSISSKDSLDDDSRTDFLDVTMMDRVATPVLTSSYLTKSDVSSNEGISNLPSSDLEEMRKVSPGIDYVQQLGLVSRNTSAIEGISANNKCHIYDMESNKERFIVNNTTFGYDTDSDLARTKTLLHVTHNPAHSFLNQQCYDKTVSKAISSNLSNNTSSSHLLKIVPEFKDIIAKKLINVVESRETSMKQSSEHVSPILTCYPQECNVQPQQHQVINSGATTQPISTNISAHDNSTQRAAATLLELSANPLYNSYIISPETSEAYHEKVYQIHPTLDDGESEANNRSHDRHDNSPGIRLPRNMVETGAHRSIVRTSRRVGRPPKDQYYTSDTASSEKNKTTSCISTSVSASSVRTHAAQSSNIYALPVPSKHTSINVSGYPSSMFYEHPLRQPLVNTTDIFTSSTPLTMSRVIKEESGSNYSNHLNLGLRQPVSSPSSINISSPRANLRAEVPTMTASSEYINKYEYINCDQVTKVCYSNPTRNLNISTPSIIVPTVVRTSSSNNIIYTSQADNMYNTSSIATDSHMVNTSHNLHMRHNRSASNLNRASINSTCPEVITTVTKTQPQDLLTTHTSFIKSISSSSGFLLPDNTHVSGTLPNDYSYSNIQFTKHNDVSFMPNNHASDIVSSAPKLNRNPTLLHERKEFQRNINVQEQVQLEKIPSNHMSVETERLTSAFESPTTKTSNISLPKIQMSSMDLPTTQISITELPSTHRPLNVTINNNGASRDINQPTDSELCNNNLIQLGNKNRCKKRKKIRRTNTKHINKKPNVSDIDDILHTFSSSEAALNIVVRTSFKDGLHILSIQSETDQRIPQNCDQTESVDMDQPRTICGKQIDEGHTPKNSELNGSSDNVVAQHLQYKILPTLVNSESSVSDSSTEEVIQANGNLLDVEALKEIEKEKAVTSLLAEMMYSKFRGYLP